MKQWKKVFTALVLAFTVTMAVPAVPQANILTKAEAAVVKINKKSATVSVGKTLQLKVTGTKAKIVWTTSNKTVAVVDKKGKVTAKKAGKATITATINKKKYTCVITAEPEYSWTETPFESRSEQFDSYIFQMPESWKKAEDKNNSSMIQLYPKSETEETAKSMIAVYAEENQEELDYTVLKEVYQKLAVSTLNGDAKKSTDIKITQKECQFGTAVKVEYSYQYEKDTVYCNIYGISSEGSLVTIVAGDMNSKEDPNAATTAAYLFQSLEKMRVIND